MGYTVSNENQSNFIPASEGVQEGVCVDIVDEGMIVNFDGKRQHKCRIVFEVEETNAEGTPLTVSQRFTVSLDKRSNLRQTLEKWRGKPFTDDEMKSFDLDNLIGKAGQLVITQNQREDRVYANIDNILRSKNPIQPSGIYIRRKDREGYLLPVESPWNPPVPQRRQQAAPQQRPQQQRPQQPQQPQRQAAPQQHADPQRSVPTQRINRPQPAPAQEQQGAEVPHF